MKMYIVSLCFLFLVSIGGSQQEFKLTLLWPAAHCEIEGDCQVTEIPPRFTIHGLWVDQSSHTSTETYNRNELSTHLKEQMKFHWPGLSMSDNNFWAHEWTTHGRYTGLSFGTYFNNGIAAKNKVGKIEDALSAHGIVPSSYKTYESERIGQAIELETGAVPEIHCKRDGNHILLYEVVFYFNRRFKLINAEKYKVQMTHKIVEYYRAYNCGDKMSIMFLPVPKNSAASSSHTEL